MTKKTFIFKGHKDKEFLELVHTNMYEADGVHTLRGYGYFIIFIDKYSRFGYVDLKFDAFDKFIEFMAESNNLLGKHIKAL